MKRLLLLVLLLGLCSQSVSAQFYPTKYRPPNLNWQQLATPHFNVVFPEGADSVGLRTARMLEHEYPEIQELVGGELTNFPVVLNNFNDRSNGFVSTNHFRSEIEIPSIKGKTMNPQSGNWLETVVPHELVHALHYSHLEGIWTGIVSIFSPDAARSILGGPPLGVHEGLAVYHETANIASNGGRGNYPFFTNQFNAAFNSPDRWSMGQMLSVSSYTRPFDRHYIGGYEFTNWLQQIYGESTSNNTIDFYVRWPFLGYGLALRHTTGYWPGQLYDQFEADQQETMPRKKISYHPLPIKFKGRDLRRPVWLSEDELLIYGSFYNASSGFYRYALSDSSFRQIRQTRAVQDYNYDLSADRSTLLFANYRSSPIYDNTYTMELYQLDTSSGDETRLSSNLRAFAPVYHGEELLALQTDQESSALVRLTQNAAVEESITLANTEFVSVKPNPENPSQLAIVANRRGLQGLWLVDEDSIEKEVAEAPDISFMGGSVFDPAWHPSGNRLMFSSDHTGTMQLYEFNLSSGSIRQITDAAYNAMEGSYSPGGNRVAFIVQQKNERLPAILERSDFADRTISPSRWMPSDEKVDFMTRSELGADLAAESRSWPTSDYSSDGQWLSPRTIMPVANNISNRDTYEVGISLQSNDLLQRNSYALDITYLQKRLWYDLSYRHAGFFPGFELGIFNSPSFTTITTQAGGAGQQFTFLRQNTGGSLSIPTRFVLENDVRYSSVEVTPSVKYQRTRFYGLDNPDDPVSPYTGFFVGDLYMSMNYRLQQNMRDLQPNSGIAAYSEIEHYFNGGTSQITTADEQIGISFPQPTAWQSGIFAFIAPLKRWNQSLRLGVEGLSQTGRIFSSQSLVSEGFSERIFPRSNHMLSVNTRYTVPLLFPDKGGFAFPAYISNLYLVGFSDTVADLDNHSINEFFSASRTVVGLGLRTRFRISNFTLDLGIAVGYEPARNQFNPFIGNF